MHSIPSFSDLFLTIELDHMDARVEPAQHRMGSYTHQYLYLDTKVEGAGHTHRIATVQSVDQGDQALLKFERLIPQALHQSHRGQLLRAFPC